MRLRKRHCLILATVLVCGIAPVMTSLATEPTIEAAGGGYGGYYWSPSTAEVAAGGKVTFQNTSATVPHGVVWTGGPETPSCPGVPVNEGKTTWKGTCTFTHPGVYSFHCYVHPTEMTGTITVTNPGEPVATTQAATAVTETGAMLNGTVNPSGHPTTYFFKYGTTTSYGKETSVQSAGEGTANVAASAALSGLLSGTPYHFRLVAKNEKGTVEGADQTFTTASPPGPPTASTEAATSVGETGATINGMVNPDGKPTNSFFQWGTTESYGQTTAEVPAGEGNSGHAASAALAGLTPGTLYHYRVVAKNTSSETVYGADRTFTTLSPPAPKEPPKEPAPTSTTTSPAPIPSSISQAPELAPLVAPFVEGSLKLAAPHHGLSVRGSLRVVSSGAGGRLEVDLLATRAALARRGHRPKQVIVGRLVRASVPAGKVAFSVSLSARAKSALRRHHKLAVTVKVTLTPPMGSPVTATRSIVLHA
jgi:plastocyanin